MGRLWKWIQAAWPLIGSLLILGTLCLAIPHLISQLRGLRADFVERPILTVVSLILAVGIQFVMFRLFAKVGLTQTPRLVGGAANAPRSLLQSLTPRRLELVRLAVTALVASAAAVALLAFGTPLRGLNIGALILVPTGFVVIVMFYVSDGVMTWKSLTSLNLVGILSPTTCFAGVYAFKNRMLERSLPTRLDRYTAAMFLAGVLLCLYFVLLAFVGPLAAKELENNKAAPGNATLDGAADEPFLPVLWACVALLCTALSMFLVVICDIAWQLAYVAKAT